MTVAIPVVPFNLPLSDWGKGPGGDTGAPIYLGSVLTLTPSNISSAIDTARLKGMKSIPVSFSGPRDSWTTLVGSCKQFSRTLPDGSPGKFQTNVEAFNAAHVGQALFDKIVQALNDRIFICYVVDEPFHQQFCGTISKDDVNWMCLVHKQVFGYNAITAVRVSPLRGVNSDGVQSLYPPPVGGWTWLDYSWAQSEGPLHQPSNGETPGDFFRRQLAAANSMDVGMIFGHNLLDGGSAACWPYKNDAASGRIVGTFAQGGLVGAGQSLACSSGTQGNTRWFTPPTELMALVDDIMADPDLYENMPLFSPWSHSPRNASTDAIFTPLELRPDVAAGLDYTLNAFGAIPSSNGWRAPKGTVPAPDVGSVALEAKVVSFNIGTGIVNSTVTVAHGLGTTPKAIILFGSGITFAGNSTSLGSYQRSFGWSIGIAAGQSMAIASVAAHNGAAGTANIAKRAASNAACILALTAAGGMDGKADVKAWDDTNIIFEILDPFAASLRITMLVLGGGAITDVAVGTAASPTGGTVPYTTDITALPFTPAGNGESLALFMTAGDVAAFSENIIDDSGFSVGAAASPSQRGVIYSGSDNLANPTTVRSYTYPGEAVMATRTSVGALNWRADFVAWLANGFRLNHLEISTVGIPYGYLVINGPQVAVLQAVTSTSNGADVALTGAGFPPVAGLVLSAREAQNTQDTATAGTGVSIGAFDGTNQAAHASEESNSVATSVVRRGVEHDQSYIGVSNAGALIAAMALQSLDADGVTFDTTDGDESAYQFHAILFGDRVGGMTAVRQTGLSRIEDGRAGATAVSLGGFLQT